MQIGSLVKKLRTEKKLSLRDLSRASGCSISFLSQVERDMVSPTVSSLKKIADSLGVTMSWFFEGTDQRDCNVVVQKSERTRFHSQASRTTYESLKPQGANSVLEPLYHVLEPGAYSGTKDNTHTGEEFIYVVKGEIEIQLDGVPYRLVEGDSAVYNSSIPHRWRNLIDGRTEVIWVNTPPTF